ncbi:2-oxoglutarate dehydrogenase E1 component [Bdellovibrionota bacterium FG-1]
MELKLEKFSYLKSTNTQYIDEMFDRYNEDPDAVDSSWRYFFDGMELGSPSVQAPPSTDLSQESKVAELIIAYRGFGRLVADLDPLTPPQTSHPMLELSRFQLSAGDLQKTFAAGKMLGMGAATLSEIIARLRETYSSSIGVEFTHIQDRTEREWLQQKMESSRNRENFDLETRQFILRRLSESEGFERFLHTRYVAQKRFSIEGGESVIPALDCVIEIGAEHGATEFVLGMAHRGRLNVLTHIFGKKPEYIFTEFEGTYKTDLSLGEGDVKYHMGYSADFKTRKGKDVHLSLANNPSHLEFVNPVIEGMARAKQTYLGDTHRTKVIPIQIHGDAAFAGQGVCYETLGLSQLAGYNTGGTLHLVINNQVGFTTSPKDSRSTTYSTDLAKMLETPIFHINGDDPEAVWYGCKLAIEYRQTFKKDVFIDLICYRKHGHNEGDEPTFTQPLLYRKIKNHTSTRALYAQKLESENLIPPGSGQKIVDEITVSFLAAQALAKAEAPHPGPSVFGSRWKGLKRPTEGDIFKTVNTSVEEKTLKELAEKLNRSPAGFSLHPKLRRFFEARLKAVQDGQGLDWGNGETLAYASLVHEGYPVRLSGQDAERGTFTHRHCVLNDFETGEAYCPLNHLSEGQALFDVHNSSLSETAVLGFEYGFSLSDPNTLSIWEAQFGDFANGAQVIIDQFIASGESKWQRMSGLTLLLPHGYEGQGPEHSSARLERFLQLCGKNNLTVANFTTPAQLFHGLRRQIKRDFRKPLIIMSPKSMLRHPLAISSLADFAQGQFQEVITDTAMTSISDRNEIKRIILCSGKIYYDLLAERTLQNRKDTAIIRVEQLYPWPAAALKKALNEFKNTQKIIWVQEEPQNMGAWSFVFNTWSGGYDQFGRNMGNKPIFYVGRDVGAASAGGSPKVHETEQKEILKKAFNEEPHAT